MTVSTLLGHCRAYEDAIPAGRDESTLFSAVAYMMHQSVEDEVGCGFIACEYFDKCTEDGLLLLEKLLA